ncbi:MAG TPA: hypothetical protein VNO52_08050, partial [Methylomirabilota bacterium]|nr:hypothetical protein [Methylomirabilota bacterium]
DRGYLNAPLYGTADDLYGDGDDLTADAALATKIFETPLRLALPTSGGDQRPPHTLAAVMVRGDLFTNGYNVYLKRGASSFNVIRTDNTFAVRGTLAADYPADTDKIDTRLGFLLNVNSADNDLETPELDEALDGRYLILLGAEILSLVSATLVSGTQFRCYAIRGMFDTIRLAHPAGSEAFIFPRRDLSPFTSKRFALGMVATFKVQPFVDDNERDLSSIGEQTHVITARARRPLPPANLRRCQNATDLHGDAKNPTYKASGGMATIYLRWDLTDPAHDDFWQQWRAVQAPAWSGTETYSRYDRVSHKGGTFTSLVDGNSAIEPGVSGSWQNSWLMETPFETRTVLDFLTLGIGCTLDHTTDKVQKTSHGLANGAKLYLDGATLPPELPPGTLLYVVNATTDDFQLALRANGDAVAFSANGSAVVYSLVKRTVEVGRSKSSYTVTYSTLTGASWFNTSPLDGFIVRAHGKANGLLSTWFIDLKLTREP